MSRPTNPDSDLNRPMVTAIQRHLPIERFLTDGANANYRFTYMINSNSDSLTLTVLHFAALCGNTPAVQSLLAHGADPAALDGTGNTALGIAQHLQATQGAPGRTLTVAALEQAITRDLVVS